MVFIWFLNYRKLAALWLLDHIIKQPYYNLEISTRWLWIVDYRLFEIETKLLRPGTHSKAN